MANIPYFHKAPRLVGLDEISGLMSRAGHHLAHVLRPAVETPAARIMTLIACAMLAGLWVFSGMLATLFIGAAESDSLNRARNTAIMTSAYIRQTMTSGDIVLRSMKSFLVENGVVDDASYRQVVSGRNVHEALRDRVGNLQEIDKAAFISAKGEVLNFSFKYPVPPINVADRDYFRQQMEPSPPPLTVGIVALDRGSGKWTFYLSQRVVDAAGTPIGLAIVGLKADFLADFFEETSMRKDVAIVLQRDDGVVLTGSGISRDLFGKMFPAGQGVLTATAGTQLFETSGPPSIPTLEGGENYVEAAMAIRGFPLRIVVLVDRMAFLKRAIAWSIALAAAAMIGSIIIFLTWRRSLRLIREGLRMSRISSMQAMISAIAHELNQPLAATSNYLAVVSRRLHGSGAADPEQQRDVIEKARSQLLRAGDIIKRLRSFISDGKTELREVELAQVIDGAVDFSLVRDRHKDVDVDVHLETGPCRVSVDPIQVQQVLLNLIRNSAEAMAGRHNKRIEVVSRVIGSKMVEVRVSDTGPGLPANVARHVFEPFNTTKTDGMGVGLAICRTIIESHGGTIRYFAGANGANFVFTLRRADA